MSKRELRSKIKRWVNAAQTPLTFLGIAAPVCSAIVWLAGRSDYDLVFWTRDDIVVYPSEVTNDLPLPLAFDGHHAKSVTISDISIGNLGKLPIGEQTKLWTLDVSVRPPARLAYRNEMHPRISPERTVLSLPPEQTSQHSLQLRLGVLEPRADVRFQVLVIDADYARRPRIQFETDLDGIPKPLETHSALYERLAQKVFLWIWFLAIGAFVLSILWDAHKQGLQLAGGMREVLKREVSSYTWWSWLKLFSLVVIAWPFLAAILALILSYGIGYAAVGMMFFM